MLQQTAVLIQTDAHAAVAGRLKRNIDEIAVARQACLPSHYGVDGKNQSFLQDGINQFANYAMTWDPGSVGPRGDDIFFYIHMAININKCWALH